MNRLKNLHVQGFRRLRDVQFEVRPLMVLIGANGVGKTSVLDVFSMLSSAANGELNKWLNEAGGLNSILTLDGTQRMSFALAMELPEFPSLTYELTIAAQGNFYAVESESLVARERDETSRTFIQASFGKTPHDALGEFLGLKRYVANSLETILSQASTSESPVGECCGMLKSCTLYHTLNVENGSKVRLPQAMRPATLPGIDGEFLASLLYNMRETNRDRFERVEDALRAAFPSFDGLGFPPVAAGTMAMTWKDKNYSTPIYMHQLSEGMLRFLWLTSLLQSPGLPAITMIDEPEVSMHPELLSLLADLFREASQRTQLIVATHSDRLVSFLEPNEVLVLDRQDNGDATMTWADTMDLDIWLADYSLDEVWRMGRMGGRS